MVNTNRLDYKKDLEEVVYMFCDGDGIEIEHVEENDGTIFKNSYVFRGGKYDFINEKKTSSKLERKRFEKRFSKLALYNILSNAFGVTYEWGALTGIRPVKMARTFEDFENQFKNVFKVSDKKIKLVCDILKTQKPYYDKDGKYCDLFIGVPFCPSRCAYCSFISQEISKCNYVDEYVLALKREIEHTIPMLRDLRSIYIGGGTPICLSETQLEIILKTLKPLLFKDVEFTVEAGRPDAITEEKLKLLKEYGVNRICVNPQTFSNKTLSAIGRKHTAESVIEKFKLAKRYGFIINCDIIAGLTGEDFNDFKNTVDTIIKLSPENFTVHTLCLKKGASLKENCKRLQVGEISKMTDYAYQTAIENGYNPYYLYRQKFAADNLENTGYSKPGKECLYNIDVMEETSSNIACGANSVSKVVLKDENKIERYGAPKDIKTYISKIDLIISKKKELFSNKG